MFRKLLAAALACTPLSAQAATWQATSTHYVVYTKGTEQTARDLATKLEKYETVLRFLNGVKEDVPALKVRLFMADGQEALSDYTGGEVGSILGFYSSDIRGPYAVMDSKDDGIAAQTVLFHELAHHFMYQHFPATYPTWYSEGFADYHGTTKFGPDNVVTIGDIVPDRYRTFAYGGWVPIKDVLGAHNYGETSVFHVYSEGWLLTHMLTTNENRRGQLAAYLKAINSGQSYADAAKVFGNLNKLDSELQTYAHKRVLQTTSYPFKPIDPGVITTRELGPAEAALMTREARLSVGILKTKVGAYADDVVRIAARFPNDPYALGVQTDALLMAERYQPAHDSATRWVAVAPNDPRAKAMLATADLQLLRAAKSTDTAALERARMMLRDAAKAAPRNPQILKAYYDAYDTADKPPPAFAWKAMTTAYALLPGNSDLGYDVARDYERRGMIDDAIAEISPYALQRKDEGEQSPKEKAKHAKEREKYRAAGDTSTESPREMLTRLRKLKGESDGEAAAAPTKAG